MLAARLHKSTAFRLYVVYILIFVSAYLVANVFAYKMVVQFLDDRLNSSVVERYNEIRGAFERRGSDGAIAMIESHGSEVEGTQTLYTLATSSGEFVAGNTRLENVPTGYSTLNPNDQLEIESHYKLYRGPIGSLQLIVGISSFDRDQLSHIVLVGFGSATGVVLGLGLLGATILSVKSRRRITRLARTAHAIGHGELSKRLPISPRMDDIDLLATEVNVGLARLETSVASLKQVTVDIAHDLKTPITRAFLILEDALQSDDDGAMSEGIERVMVELKSITDTFDALLRISQIESRSRKSQFSVFDINVVVDEVLEVFEDLAVDRHFTISRRFDNDACLINGDIDLIRQLIANLISNSFRHTPQGTHIRVLVSRQMGRVFLTVADNGPGIPFGERKRVFDRFYRLDRSRGSSGSGLGLSLVKAISDLHNAEIEILDNSPGLRIIIGFDDIDSWQAAFSSRASR